MISESTLLRGSLVGLMLVLTACTEALPTDAPQQEAPSTSSASAGKKVFDDSKIHTVELTMADADWKTIIDLADKYENVNAKFPYFHAELTFDGEKMAEDVAVRLKGHISIPLSKGHAYPLKIDFNRYAKDQTLDGLKKLNLNTNFDGPTLPIMRDYLSYGAWLNYGVAASRTSFARVTLNSQVLGIYVLLEQVDGGFIKRHFDAPHGQLYKPEQASGSLNYKGSKIEDYPEINHKWPDEPDHKPLLNALEALEFGTMGEVEKAFDPKGIVTYLAGNVALASWDSYSSTGHNYYLYEQTPGRFTMLPWDMNGSLEMEEADVCSPTHGHLSGILFKSPNNQKIYFEILEDFLATSGSDAFLLARLDAAEKLVGSELPKHDFEALRGDIKNRSKKLHAELSVKTSCD